jgi:hypothetical protein
VNGGENETTQPVLACCAGWKGNRNEGNDGGVSFHHIRCFPSMLLLKMPVGLDR